MVDLLLSLLSQDRNALRQVVKSVASLLCPHMTDAALQAVMDVVGGSGKDDKGDSDSDEEEDDEFEPIEGGDEEEKDEASDDDSDDSDEDEDKEVDQAFREKVKAALGDGAAAAEDDDAASVDMDDLDDEDMAKMDAALAKVFRELSGKKNWMEEKRDKLDALANMHFKVHIFHIHFRTDLIDIFVYLDNIMFRV